MKKTLREHIRKQISFLFEAEEVDQAQIIKDKEEDIKSSEDELANIEKMKKDTLLQQQNKQKIASTQVGTFGDNKSKSIKTNDIKRDVELYKQEFQKYKEKEELEKQSLELKKSQLDAEKAKTLGTQTTATTPSAPSAPPAI
jgi:pyridoxine 5'-phosphate synthase PdxJ